MQSEKTSIIDEHANESMPGTGSTTLQGPGLPGDVFRLNKLGSTVDDGGSHTDPPDVEG